MKWRDSDSKSESNQVSNRMLRIWLSKLDRCLSHKVAYHGEPEILSPRRLMDSSLQAVWSRNYRVDWMPIMVCAGKGYQWDMGGDLDFSAAVSWANGQ